MTVKTVLEIVELTLAVAKSLTAGKIQEDAVLADNILQIIKKAVEAGQSETNSGTGTEFLKDPNSVPVPNANSVSVPS